jgi:hypothetical protein
MREEKLVSRMGCGNKLKAKTKGRMVRHSSDDEGNAFEA